MNTTPNKFPTVFGGIVALLACSLASAQDNPATETLAPSTQVAPSVNEQVPTPKPPAPPAVSPYKDAPPPDAMLEHPSLMDEDISLTARLRRMKGYASVGWDMGVGVGSFHDFVGNVSFAGLDVEGRWFVNRHFSLGVAFGWNRFSQSGPRETYTFPNGAVTATVYRYAEFITPKGTADYYFLPEGPVMPYVGIGIGPTVVQSQLFVSNLLISDSTWHLMFSPEAGVLVPFRSGGGVGGVLVNARYNLTTANFARVSDAQYLSWQIGVFQAF